MEPHGSLVLLSVILILVHLSLVQGIASTVCYSDSALSDVVFNPAATRPEDLLTKPRCTAVNKCTGNVFCYEAPLPCANQAALPSASLKNPFMVGYLVSKTQGAEEFSVLNRCCACSAVNTDVMLDCHWSSLSTNHSAPSSEIHSRILRGIDSTRQVEVCTVREASLYEAYVSIQQMGQTNYQKQKIPGSSLFICNGICNGSSHPPNDDYPQTQSAVEVDEQKILGDVDDSDGLIGMEALVGVHVSTGVGPIYKMISAPVLPSLPTAIARLRFNASDRWRPVDDPCVFASLREVTLSQQGGENRRCKFNCFTVGEFCFSVRRTKVYCIDWYGREMGCGGYSAYQPCRNDMDCTSNKCLYGMCALSTLDQLCSNVEVSDCEEGLVCNLDTNTCEIAYDHF